MKRLAVIFPGIGYTADKPLLYHSRRLAEQAGFEIQIVNYSGFPKKVRDDAKKMRKSVEIALSQSEEMLKDVDWDAYDDILFIGKSVGTIAAAQTASNNPAKERIRIIAYTPLEETFSFPFVHAVVFTGTGDPWVGGKNSAVSERCKERNIPCYVYEGANHSLETSDPMKDIQNLQEIMKHTESFIRKG